MGGQGRREEGGKMKGAEVQGKLSWEEDKVHVW